MKAKNNTLLGLALPLPSKGYHLNQKNQLKKGFHYISKGFVSDGENIYFIEEKSDKKNKLNAEIFDAKVKKMLSASKQAKESVISVDIDVTTQFKRIKSAYENIRRGVFHGNRKEGLGIIENGKGLCHLFLDRSITPSSVVRKINNSSIYYLKPETLNKKKYKLYRFPYTYPTTSIRFEWIKATALVIIDAKKSLKDYFKNPDKTQTGLDFAVGKSKATKRNKKTTDEQIPKTLSERMKKTKEKIQYCITAKQKSPVSIV